MFILLAALNIITLIVASGFIGYYIGKGKIEIVKPVQMDEETKAKVEEQLRQNQEAIDNYNAMCKSFEHYE